MNMYVLALSYFQSTHALVYPVTSFDTNKICINICVHDTVLIFTIKVKFYVDMQTQIIMPVFRIPCGPII